MNIQYTKQGGFITYDREDWLAGMDTTSAGSNYGKGVGNPLMTGADPLRKFGYISPGYNPTDVTNVSQVTAFIRNAVNVSDNAYLIGSNSLVYKLSTLTAGTISTTAPFPHTIDHGHASEAGNDIALYYTGSTQRVFYSFSDATDWDVGIYNVVADTFDDDFMSTVPTSPLAAPYLTGGVGFPHPVIVGDDDVLYIGDRNFVHAYDGQATANGTFYPAVLTLPVGYVVTCFATTEDLQLAIGAYVSANRDSGNDTYNRGTSKVWFWNYLALDPDYARDLRDNYVSELIQWGGTTAAFTSGRKTLDVAGVNKLQALNGSQFEVVKTWSTGGLPIRGGVDNVSNDLYWNSQGRIYAYTKRPDTGAYILNNILAGGSASSGLLRFFTASSRIHVSYGATTSGGLQHLGGDYNKDVTVQPRVATPDFPPRQQGRLKTITIAFADANDGADTRAFQLNGLLDKVSTTFSSSITTITDLQQIIITTKADGTPLGDFTSLQPQLSWEVGTGSTPASDAPEVDYIRFEYENINLP